MLQDRMYMVWTFKIIVLKGRVVPKSSRFRFSEQNEECAQVTHLKIVSNFGPSNTNPLDYFGKKKLSQSLNFFTVELRAEVVLL